MCAGVIWNASLRNDSKDPSIAFVILPIASPPISVSYRDFFVAPFMPAFGRRRKMWGMGEMKLLREGAFPHPAIHPPSSSA
jgi:hypothetical protein